MFLTLYTPIQRALDGLDVWYQNRLNWAVRHRLTVMAGCAAFFVASLFCAKYIGTEFFPAADNSRIGINLQLPIGAPCGACGSIGFGTDKQVDDALRRYDEKFATTLWGRRTLTIRLLPCRTTVVISLVSISVW